MELKFLGTIDNSHLEILRTWRNEHDIWKNCRQHDLISEVHQQRWFERINAPDSTEKMYSINISDDGYKKLVGVCGLTSINRTNQSAEFSLYIAPHYQNSGYGPIALHELVNHGFKNLNLNRIWGEVFAGNPALNVFLLEGFIAEGCLRQSYFRDGKFIDSYIISALRSEYVDA